MEAYIYYQKIANFKLVYNENRKPFFIDRFPNFNISHSGKYIVIAFTNSTTESIGVDIQKVKSINLNEKALLYLDKNVKARDIKDCDDVIEMWVKKEAVLKSYGIGLNVAPSNVDVDQKIAKIEEKYFFLQEIFIDKNYKCFVATSSPVSTSKIIEIVY